MVYVTCPFRQCESSAELHADLRNLANGGVPQTLFCYVLRHRFTSQINGRGIRVELCVQTVHTTSPRASTRWAVSKTFDTCVCLRPSSVTWFCVLTT